MPRLDQAVRLYLGELEGSAAYLGGTQVWTRPSVPANVALPTVSGGTVIGQTATATSGAWTGSPTSYAYQWQVLDGAWQDVVGATGATFAVAEIGEYRVRVVASNIAGASDPAYSASFIATEGGGTLIPFANPNAYILLTNGGMSAEYTGAPGNVGSSFSGGAITEPTYMEVEIFTSGSAAGGLQFYNGTQTEAPTYAPLGQWYGEPGLSVLVAPTWAITMLACAGLPQETNQAIDLFDATPSITVRLRAAVRPNGRIWLWSYDLNGWVGGGNPATDTTPTIDLPGTGDMCFGAGVSAVGATVTLIDPADYDGVPPAGFRAGAYTE